MGTIRQYATALRFLIALTVITGFLYPAVIFAAGQLAFKNQAQGSLVSMNGKVVGSSLIGQNFAGSQWFHSRPSGAGADGYDALSSAATNAGPNEPSLEATVKSRRATVAAEEGVDLSLVPPDAITTSASGLDPEISPAYAYLQVKRVAVNRNIAEGTLNALVESHIQSRTFGFMGEPRVNVLELNIALSSLK
ncbi:MAG: potassium-transporting ATPase subunit KdpC [Actinomycetota bacterium]